MYDKRQKIVPDSHCSSCDFHGTKYKDKWGEIWIRESCCYVRRVSDWHLGGWFAGQGLTEFNH